MDFWSFFTIHPSGFSGREYFFGTRFFCQLAGRYHSLVSEGIILCGRIAGGKDDTPSPVPETDPGGVSGLWP